MANITLNRESKRKFKNDTPEAIALKEKQKRKKIATWIKSLPKDKQMFVAEYIAAECDKSFEKYTDQFTEGLDTCLTSLLIEQTEYSLEEIYLILNNFTEIILDNNRKVNELKKLAGGDWMKAADKHKEQVIEMSLQLINDGKSDKEVKSILFDKFPVLSKAMIINCFKRVKEETKIVVEAAESLKQAINAIDEMKEESGPISECDPDVEDAMEYIFPEESKNNKAKVENKMAKKTVKEAVKETKKEVKSVEVENKSIIEEVKTPSNIEVVSMKVMKELQANTEFGQVTAKSGAGIKFITENAEIFFADEEQLKSFYNVGKKIFEMI